MDYFAFFVFCKIKDFVYSNYFSRKILVCGSSRVGLDFFQQLRRTAQGKENHNKECARISY